MKNKVPAASVERACFPFAGLFFVFLVLVGLQGWNLRENIVRHLNLRENRTRLEAVMPQARTIQESLSNVSQDILSLARTNAEAQKIVTEFKIRFNPKQ